MRRLFYLCLLLILIPSICLAYKDKENCDVIFLPIAERDLFIETGGKFFFTLDNAIIPSELNSAFLFNDLADGASFRVRWYSASTNNWNLSCNGEKKVFLGVDRQANFKIINEETAEKKLYDFKKLKTLELKGKKYIVTKERTLDNKNPLAEAFIPLKEQSQTNNLHASPIKRGTFTKQLSLTWEKAPNINRNAVAVVIGNKNYSKKNPDVPNVDYAHNDADAIMTYITKVLGYRDGNVIFIKDASQAELISIFGNHNTHRGKLNNWVRPGKSDVFVFYSGHGAPGINSGRGYLLPVNADPMTVELNGYSLETLYSNLAKIPARSMTVVIDACFSGSSQNGTVVKSASSIALRRVNHKKTIPNAVLLTASNINEVASWDEDANLGLFTRYFLEGATGKADSDDFGNGDGKITLSELKNYLESEVTYMARRLYNRDQHPQVSGDPEKVLAVTN